MALRLHKNAYAGVNAHLHSYFQAKGGWSGFHSKHIGDLAEAVNAALPAGYIVDIEQSLQIREYHPDTGERIRRSEPDISLYRSRAAEGAPPEHTTSSGGSLATLTQPVIATIEVNEDLYYSALVIYRVEDDATLGRPVTQIELLSPSNKLGGGELQYREKRIATLRSGMRLVEIDYLHETPSPVKGVPRYPAEPGSTAYNITVSDPTPTLEEGVARTYGFGVDVPVPSATIPLGDDVAFVLDFGQAYQRTFGSLSAYYYRADYEQLPERYETYSAADQARIERIMEAVLAAD